MSLAFCADRVERRRLDCRVYVRPGRVSVRRGARCPPLALALALALARAARARVHLPPTERETGSHTTPLRMSPKNKVSAASIV